MNTLHLVLKSKWFDMIADGVKNEEYREITEYWCRRICTYGKVKRGFCKKNVCNIDCNCHLPSCKANVPTEITHVCFHRGYTNDRMWVEIAGISRGKGKPEWGAPDHEVFIIKLK